MAFNEAALEQAIINLLGEQGYPHGLGADCARADDAEVLLKDDLRAYLAATYADNNITNGEIEQIIRQLESPPASDLYDSNRAIMQMVSNGFDLRREDASQHDIHIQLLDYSLEGSGNIYKLVNQLEIQGVENRRIPDGILYINGIPLVVFEFKSATREEATLHDAYLQLNTRYARDIPELLKYNAFCVISDGANNKMGSLFAPYDFFYAWNRVAADISGGNQILTPDGTLKIAEPNAVYGIDGLYTMVQGLFQQQRLRDVIRHFIYFPDVSRKQEKIVCRYPQYYAAMLLLDNIRKAQRGEGLAGDGKGGTYFGTTGCGKSFTMLFLARLLMRSVEFASPTIVVITDRTDLDDQLSKQFTNAKTYIGDNVIESVESRADLRSKLKGRQSGGVFLTTIHKFTEDTTLLTERSNVIVISDEAHRSQINLDQKLKFDTDKGTFKKTYGFAKYLHDSLPNATYVGFTGTPVDATLDVFGDIVDSYTMTESVADEITVPIVYEGRAAKVVLEADKLKEIEAFYAQCAEDGSSEYQIEESKKASANMNAILGDPDRLRALAEDLVNHYENRVAEGSSVKGKAMVVCSSRGIAYDLYQELIALRPEWAEVKACIEGSTLAAEEQKEILPLPRINMIMTRGKDDPAELYDKLGNSEYRKRLDTEFKNPKSNFRIAVVVDMWLTGFDVPFLDTMYIDKPLQKHNLIQTISRVNRKFSGKDKGLVVDYLGIKNQLNLAMAQYTNGQEQSLEDIRASLIILRDHLELLNDLMADFDSRPFFSDDPVRQLHCLNMAAEFVLAGEKRQRRFMALVKRLKAAYDICSGSEEVTQTERDKLHFYVAVRSIVAKLTKTDALDTAQMNERVREMIKDALQSDGVEEIVKIGESQGEVDIFSDDYLDKINKVKLPHTRAELLKQLLAKAIEDFKKVNKAKGIDFSKRFEALVDKYNQRDEDSTLVSDVLEDFSEQLVDMLSELKTEVGSGDDIGLKFEEKAFYDILLSLAVKYDFTYPEDKLVALAKAVKDLVDDKAQFTDWAKRDDIKAELKVGLIILLAEHGYPPVDKDEVYQEIFEQAQNFKKNRNSL